MGKHVATQRSEVGELPSVLAIKPHVVHEDAAGGDGAKAIDSLQSCRARRTDSKPCWSIGGGQTSDPIARPHTHEELRPHKYAASNCRYHRSQLNRTVPYP